MIVPIKPVLLCSYIQQKSHQLKHDLAKLHTKERINLKLENTDNRGKDLGTFENTDNISVSTTVESASRLSGRWSQRDSLYGLNQTQDTSFLEIHF